MGTTPTPDADCVNTPTPDAVDILQLKIYGSAWFPAGEPFAGLIYCLDQDGNKRTQATEDLEYHAMVVDAFAKLGPGVTLDPEKYAVGTEGWSIDQAEMIEDPREGWAVE